MKRLLIVVLLAVLLPLTLRADLFPWLPRRKGATTNGNAVVWAGGGSQIQDGGVFVGNPATAPWDVNAQALTNVVYIYSTNHWPLIHMGYDQFLIEHWVQGASYTQMRFLTFFSETVGPMVLISSGDSNFHVQTNLFSFNKTLDMRGNSIINIAEDSLVFSNGVSISAASVDTWGDSVFGLAQNELNDLARDSASVYLMPAYLTDPFTDETGIDTASSANEVYDAAGDSYSPLATAYAAKFDGSAYAENATGFRKTTNCTWSAWLYPTNTVGNNYPFCVWADASETYVIGMYIDDGVMKCKVGRDTSIPETMLMGASSATNSGWQHYIFTVATNGNWSAYRNGSLVANGALAGAATYFAGYDTSDLSFGGINAAQDYEGYIDQAWFREGTCSVADAVWFYNSGLGRQVETTDTLPSGGTFGDGLLAYYNCDEGSGTTFTDSSGNGKDLTQIVASLAWTNTVVPSSASLLSLVSTNHTLSFQPNRVRAVVQAEEIEVVDSSVLTVYASRDAGSTFTQVPLGLYGTWGSIQIYTGSVSIAAQPSGSNLVAKIVSGTNRNYKVHGWHIAGGE